MKDAPASGSDETPVVDAGRIVAIVPAYNAEAEIGRCIAALCAAGLPRDAITVVDDGSSDNTVGVCRAAGVEPIRAERNGGAASARNLGAARSSADILLFLDADVLISPDAVGFIDRFFAEHADIAAVFGCYDEVPEYPTRVSRIRNLLHRHVHLRHAGEAVTFWTGCGAVRRSAFDAVGGFDPDQTMMEDVKFGMELARRGKGIRLNPDLRGTHLKRWTWAGMFRTDLFDRAIPWSRLLLGETARGMPKVLNVDLSARLSVIAVAASLAGLTLVPFTPGLGGAVALLALGALALLNLPFLVMLWRLGRPLDSAAAIPVLWLHYLCGGLGFALVRAGF